MKTKKISRPRFASCQKDHGRRKKSSFCFVDSILGRREHSRGVVDLKGVVEYLNIPGSGGIFEYPGSTSLETRFQSDVTLLQS
jgi:hypothetical protein